MVPRFIIFQYGLHLVLGDDLVYLLALWEYNVAN